MKNMQDVKISFPRDEEELFEELNEKTAVLNGGTDVMVKCRTGSFPAERLVSLEKMEGLSGISDEGDSVRILCRTTHHDLMESRLICDSFPLLVKTVYEIGSTQIRNRGTLAGNIVNASPAADGLLALYILNAFVVLKSGTGEKTVRIEDFIKGPGKTVLEKGEYLHSIIIPKISEQYRPYFKKVGQRKAMAIAIASIGAVYKLKKNRIMDIRLAFGSLGPRIIRPHRLESDLRGKVFNPETFLAFSEKIADIVTPISDVRASKQYREKVARNLFIGLCYSNSGT